MQRHCLNCQEEVSKKFCPNCGQKADTHRITLRNFIAHDLLHGVWHLERGILFTAKEAIVRPGKAALDYIGGKRIRYYNVFYLCLLVIAANIVLNHLYDSYLYDPKAVREDSAVAKFFAENVKFIVLAIVPILAFNGWLLFGKLKLNLAEHFIIGGMTLLGTLFWVFPLFLVKFLEEIWIVDIGILKLILVLPLLFYPAWTYFNATRGTYRFSEFAWRAAAYLILIYVQVLGLSVLLAYLATNDSALIINV